MDEQIKWLELNITSLDIKNIELYTSVDGYNINKDLRRGIFKRYKDVIDGLDNLFDTIPQTKENIILYRNTDIFNQDLNKGYISTTFDLFTLVDINETKCNGYLLEITIPKGSKILPISKYSVDKSEKEVLLPRNTIFSVTNSTYKYGYKFLQIINVSTEINELTNIILNNLNDLYEEISFLNRNINDFMDYLNIYIDNILLKYPKLKSFKNEILNSTIIKKSIEKLFNIS